MRPITPSFSLDDDRAPQLEGRRWTARWISEQENSAESHLQLAEFQRRNHTDEINVGTWMFLASVTCNGIVQAQQTLGNTTDATIKIRRPTAITNPNHLIQRY